MKIQTLIPALLLFAVVSVHGKDMQEYLSKTQELVSQGKHEEALERFIWFHNHALEYRPSMYGVRLSFALSYWKRLGDVYPPALEAMERIRDEKTELLREGEGDHHLFHDVSALNRTLGDNEKTIQLFEQIAKDQPEQARQLWRVTQEVVIEARRYDIARKYIEDPAREFATVKERFEHNVKLYDDPRFGEERFRSHNENRLVEDSLKLIDLAFAFDNREAAKEIQKQALALVNDDRLRKAIPE